MEKAILKTKGGEYLQVCLDTKKEAKLYALDTQDCDTFVFILTREINQRKQMAFQFPYRGEHYSPKVEGEDIKLEKVSVTDGSLTVDSHWFEKVNVGAGEVYSLKTVVESPQYLTLPKGGSRRRRCPLSLTPEPLQCLHITDEKA